MVEVYIHLPTEEAKNSVICGIKLSEKKSRVISYKGYETACFTAWLHPDDDRLRCKDERFQCVKLMLNPRYCYVADGDLTESETYFKNSIKLYEEYRLGEYRHPKALVACTVVPGKAILQGHRLDTPLLYTNSEELYKEKLYTYLSTEYDNAFSNDMLYSFFNTLWEQGEVERVDAGHGVLFIHRSSGRHFTFDKPKSGTYKLDEL